MRMCACPELHSRRQQQLCLYALFKQATNGPCKSERPGMFDMIGRAKWDAWKALPPDLSPDAARKQYVSATLHVCERQQACLRIAIACARVRLLPSMSLWGLVPKCPLHYLPLALCLVPTQGCQPHLSRRVRDERVTSSAEAISLRSL